MNHLTRNDYATALQLLARIETQAAGVEGFTRAAVTALNDFVSSERTTLSVCDLLSGQCRVVSVPGVPQGTADRAARFGPRFFAHPLALARQGRRVLRCTGSSRQRHGHRCPLCARRGGRVGLEHTVSLPLYRDGRTVVSIVLNRRGPDFGERDRERLELLRPHLAFLYAHACRTVGEGPSQLAPPDTAPAALTAREREVLHWLASGKTDADIAALLSISTRTVNKHLEHVYVKLGVETRTAAVMRALSAGLVDGCVLPAKAAGPVDQAASKRISRRPALPSKPTADTRSA